MKKKLEAELISIAHRILKLKNKSELVQLHQETQKLYEKLSVLRFVEENFADVKPTIGYSEIEEKIESAFENNDVSDEKPEVVSEETESVQTEEKPVEETSEEVETATVSEEESNDEQTSEENNNEPVIEAEIPEETVSEVEKEETVEVETEIKTETSEKPETENVQPEAENIEPIAEIESPEETVSEVEKEETAEAETEDKTEEDSSEEIKPETSNNDAFKPSFELAFDPKEDPDTDKFNTPAQTSLEDFLHDNYVDPIFVTPEDLQKEKEEKAAQSYASYQSETPAKSLNDRMSKGIIIGLNDRIAFMNHLFNNSSEDYNRVLSQLMTIDTFSEAKEFIENMVKPDYNNWSGKEEYEQRFMEIIEKKFS